MKKIGLLFALVLCLVMLVGCDGYVNSYSAVGMIKSVWGDEASLEFGSFQGTYNYKMKTVQSSDHTIDYGASLTEGEMNVYIDVDGEKELLFNIKGGESLDTSKALEDKYDDAKSIRIIVETVGKCKGGEFEFDME